MLCSWDNRGLIRRPYSWLLADSLVLSRILLSYFYQTNKPDTPWSLTMSIPGLLPSGSASLLPRWDVLMKRPKSVNPDSWGVISNHLPEPKTERQRQKDWDIKSVVLICVELWVCISTWLCVFSTCFRAILQAVLAYCVVDRIGIGSVYSMLRKTLNVQL